MVKLLQKTLDLFAKKNNLPFRYIIRFYTKDVSGFGGLKLCTIELYKRESGKSIIIFNSEIKSKSDEVEDLVCIDIMNFLINGNGTK